MSRVRRAGAALGALILLGGGGWLVSEHDVAGEDAIARGERAVEGDGELLQLAEPPPAAPPTVRLERTDASAEEQAVEGTLYQSTWLTEGRTVVREASIPVRWGPEQRFDGSGSVVLEVAAKALPSSLTVYVFASEVDDVGEPTSSPVIEVDCSRDDMTAARGACVPTRLPDHFALPIPELPEGELRISVTAAWFETGSTSSGERVLYDTATWLFHLGGA